MKDKFRLYHRGNGTYYAEDRETGARESLGTKIPSEAENLLHAKNDRSSSHRSIAKWPKFISVHKMPRFANRTWQDVADLIDAAYERQHEEALRKIYVGASR